MKNSSQSSALNVSRTEWRFAHVIVAFMAGTVGVPLVMFGTAFVLYPGDIAFGNSKFWSGILIGSVVSVLVVYRRRRIHLGLAALAGASVAIIFLLCFFVSGELINAIYESELD
jgi:hypothetical protein